MQVQLTLTTELMALVLLLSDLFSMCWWSVNDFLLQPAQLECRCRVQNTMQPHCKSDSRFSFQYVPCASVRTALFTDKQDMHQALEPLHFDNERPPTRS